MTSKVMGLDEAIKLHDATNIRNNMYRRSGLDKDTILLFNERQSKQ